VRAVLNEADAFRLFGKYEAARVCPSWCIGADCRDVGRVGTAGIALPGIHEGTTRTVDIDDDDRADGDIPQIYVRAVVLVDAVTYEAFPAMVEIDSLRDRIGRLHPDTARELAAHLISAADEADEARAG
jgi:hypothetical protein